MRNTQEIIKVVNYDLMIDIIANEVIEHDQDGDINMAEAFDEWIGFSTNDKQAEFAQKYRGAIISRAIELIK